MKLANRIQMALLAAVSTLMLGSAAQAEIAGLTCDAAGANSTVANPFKIEIKNAGGAVVQTIDVTTIVLGDTAAQKVAKIYAATPALYRGTPLPPGGDTMWFKNVPRLGSLKVTDPTKEGLDKLNAERVQGGKIELTGTAVAGGSVQAGIDGVFVAMVNPSNLQTAASVLAQLESQLDANGLPSSISGSTLTIGGISIADSLKRDLVFGNTNGSTTTGLLMTAEIDTDDAGIPTVSAWGLFTLTLLVLAAGTVVLRRRMATKLA